MEGFIANMLALAATDRHLDADPLIKPRSLEETLALY